MSVDWVSSPSIFSYREILYVPAVRLYEGSSSLSSNNFLKTGKVTQWVTLKSKQIKLHVVSSKNGIKHKTKP